MKSWQLVLAELSTPKLAVRPSIPRSPGSAPTATVVMLSQSRNWISCVVRADAMVGVEMTPVTEKGGLKRFYSYLPEDVAIIALVLADHVSPISFRPLL